MSKCEIPNAFHQTAYPGQAQLIEKRRIYLSHAACTARPIKYMIKWIE